MHLLWCVEIVYGIPMVAAYSTSPVYDSNRDPVYGMDLYYIPKIDTSLAFHGVEHSMIMIEM